MKRILYLLTEERPKVHTIARIIDFEYYITLSSDAKIVPIMSNKNKFSFVYEAKGFDVYGFDAVLIVIVSGHSSFVDYLVFDSDTLNLPEQPTLDLSYHFNKNYIVPLPLVTDSPLYIVEETKTDDRESRNTQAYQRSSKFIFSEIYYGETVNKYMLYELDNDRSMTSTPTHKFGMRMLVTNNIILKGLEHTYKPFTNLKEFIEEKNKISESGRIGNVPLKLFLDKQKNTIYLSAKLDKGTGTSRHKISHDPNIGAVAIISATLRKLGWKGAIEIINHNLLPTAISSRSLGNKLLFLMKKLNVEFFEIDVNWAQVSNNINYFFFNKTSEKIASIYYHLYVENKLNDTIAIFDNHAGCGKSYFNTPDGYLPVSKDTPIPDLVLYDSNKNTVKVIEAEHSLNVLNGVTQLNTFKSFIDNYVITYYPGASVECSVITFGKSTHPKVSFYLDFDGSVVFSDDI